VQLITPS
jgi:hypothetical protein